MGEASVSRLKMLYHLTLSPIRGGSHQERLESFYQGQAQGYDSFRRRLLHGRQEMFSALPVEAGGVWVDLGAGTGENAEHLGEKLGTLSQAYLVDLCGPLLEVARERVTARGWQNVEVVQGDATSFTPSEGADLVTFSYSLTMIPDWYAAVENAWRMLKPGGVLGVVDFYVSRKYPADERRGHGWMTRALWPLWFGSDNVYLSPDHLPLLERRFEVERVEEGMGSVPYLPLVKVPYYWFVGRKAR